MLPEIVENLEAALEQFRSVSTEVAGDPELSSGWVRWCVGNAGYEFSRPLSLRRRWTTRWQFAQRQRKSSSLVPWPSAMSATAVAW